MQAEIKAEYIEEQKEDNIIELRIQLENKPTMK
jgi:hypothetical protein